MSSATSAGFSIIATWPVDRIVMTWAWGTVRRQRFAVDEPTNESIAPSTTSVGHETRCAADHTERHGGTA